MMSLSSIIRYACLVLCIAVTGFAHATDRAPAAPSLPETLRFKGDVRLLGRAIPLQIPQVLEDLEKEMLLAVWDRPQVILWLKRAHRVFPVIEKVLTAEGLPTDLKYVAVVESGLRAHASSSKGAVGYWQFLRATGRKYGLRIDKYIDERRHLERSTLAAAAYLKKLEQEFGDYFLALAAYNMGEFGLAMEIEAQETRDFFSLSLPQETQRYLYKIATAKLIMEHPERYGFYLAQKDLYPLLACSKINFSVKKELPLSLIAKAAKISFKTLKNYNPHIRGYYLKGGTVLVPKGMEIGFKKRFSALHGKWTAESKTRFHVVRPGESLTGIAEHYDMSLPALLRLNRFSYNKVIHPGDRILVR